MEPNIVLNFQKTHLDIDSLFNFHKNQQEFEVEFMNPGKNSPAETIREKIFILKIGWKNTNEIEMMFVTLFKMAQMIPGIYKMSFEKKALQKGNQEWAYRIPE